MHNFYIMPGILDYRAAEEWRLQTRGIVTVVWTSHYDCLFSFVLKNKYAGRISLLCKECRISLGLDFEKGEL